MENRDKIARGFAEKDKRVWDDLPDVMKSAYLHYADTDIKTRELAPVIVDGKEVEFACKVCKDKAYIDGKPCPECNPVGLPAVDVHPTVVAKPILLPPGKTGDADEPLDRMANLCDSCAFQCPICDSPNVEYGDDVGKDNIIKCEIYKQEGEVSTSGTQRDDNIAASKIIIEAEGKRATRALRPNEYRCTKCSKPGKTIIHVVQKSGKGVGTKHLKFKAA